MDEKRRTLVHQSQKPWTSAYQKDWTTNPDLGIVTTGFSPPTTSLQVTMSRGHAWNSSKQAVTDTGGNFTTSKIDEFIVSDAGSHTGRGFGFYYSGPEWAINPKSAIQDAMASVSPGSEAYLLQKGTTAISNCIPTNPVADAGTFIGELKEGLPKFVGKELWKSKLKDYRKVGSEYLNVQFGWLPLVSDLQKFGKAATESNKILEQLHKDSGKNVRRKYTFPDEVTERTGTIGSSLSHLGLGGSGYPYLYKSAGGAPITYSVNVRTQTWFSGCFTYHLNLGNTLPDKIARQAAEARKLFGVELTPETVWNLAPWSWAVDWEGNIGDVLHNVSRFSQDGLVMRYGYIMQKKTAIISYSLHPSGRLANAPNAPLTLVVKATSRVRRRATPFGFGFDMTALTGRQSAILGALGISRGPRHL